MSECPECGHTHTDWVDGGDGDPGGFICNCGCTFDPEDPPLPRECRACGEQSHWKAESCERCGQPFVPLDVERKHDAP